MKLAGKIKLGHRVVVSDPCYQKGVWCAGTLDNVKPGLYEVEVSYMDCGNWGRRVSMIKVLHEDYSGIPVGFNDTGQFEVGVDSGCAGIYDAEYFDKYHVSEVDNEWLEMAFEATDGKDRCGTLDDMCVISASGFGDGGYECYITRDRKDRIISIGIVFITPDDVEE